MKRLALELSASLLRHAEPLAELMVSLGTLVVQSVAGRRRGEVAAGFGGC